jgi:hypothetical protein
VNKLLARVKGFPGHPSHPPLTDASIGAYTVGVAMLVLGALGVEEEQMAHGSLFDRVRARLSRGQPQARAGRRRADPRPPGGGPTRGRNSRHLTRSSPAGGIVAVGRVPAPSDEVFDFLSDLENHWLLADRFIEVIELERPAPGAPAHGGRVRMRGPLGLSRTAVTRVADMDRPRTMAGTAEVGARTRARVSWMLSAVDGSTAVELRAEVVEAARLDRLLLAAGGAGWMRRRFQRILAALARRFSAPS